MINEWYSSIAVADLADWVTVAAYLCTAMLSARASENATLRRQKRERMFWRITAALLVLLGINELLDLQTLLTYAGREYAKASGWYGEHRRVQYIFVVALGLTAASAGIAMLWFTRRTQPAVRLALFGLGFIGTFIFLRAASFHHLDDLLGGGMPQFNWGSMQEIAGILIIAAAAAGYSRDRRRIF